MYSKPAWVDSNPEGKISCDKCLYKTDSVNFLNAHSECYHHNDKSFILYMECTGSLTGRNTLADAVSVDYIDMTGGQAAFEDGDLQIFGSELVAASRKSGYKLYNVYRMHDPGLGLMFSEWWVDTGIALNIFQKYDLPEDVKAGPEDSDDEDSE